MAIFYLESTWLWELKIYWVKMNGFLQVVSRRFFSSWKIGGRWYSKYTKNSILSMHVLCSWFCRAMVLVQLVITATSSASIRRTNGTSTTIVDSTK